MSVNLAGLLVCPLCGALAASAVIDSRGTDNGGFIRRRRWCQGCQGRYTTYEIASPSAGRYFPLQAAKKLLKQLLDRATSGKSLTMVGDPPRLMLAVRKGARPWGQEASKTSEPSSILGAPAKMER